MIEYQHLNGNQLDMCKQAARRRVEKRLGERPTRAAFRREYAPLASVLDWLALVIFAAALAVSSLHILHFAGSAATDAYHALPAGISVNLALFVVTHQIGLILLAECSMLLFVVGARLAAGRRAWAEAGVSGLLAVLAVLFVLAANLSSGLPFGLALLAPAFTVGIGFRLESIITERLRRTAEIDVRYLAALELYETSSNDPTQHPEYLPVLRSEVWGKLISLRANEHLQDATPEQRRAIVAAELARDEWAAAPEPGDRPVVPFGSTAPAAAAVASTPMTASANGSGHEKIGRGS